jgi:ABC-type multidrug transport system fused ATPase/permease subunit
LDAVEKWPGGVAYVPQNIIITNGTIRKNVGLGFPVESIKDELVWDALDVAQLSDFIREIPGELDSHVGDSGSNISGGQRQRLGIARAMFTKPKLLVLDEATSSLDGETEANVTDSIHKLKGEVTVVLIAHRLSTVRQADVVVYLDKGKILSKGTFDEVRASVPDFDHQAQLMGL